MPRRRPRTIGFFTLLVVMVFLVTIGLAVGVFLYKSYLNNDIAKMRDELAKMRASFDPARISELERLDIRIKEAKKRLDAHTAPTLLFELLQTNTLQNVRYKEFEYEATGDQGMHIKINGQGKNFSSIALQSDEFGGNKNVLNPIFDELNPDQEGFVDFTVDANVAPDFISYGNSLGFGTIETPEPAGKLFNEGKSSFNAFGNDTNPQGNPVSTSTTSNH